jgi:hypothetical protein
VELHHPLRLSTELSGDTLYEEDRLHHTKWELRMPPQYVTLEKVENIVFKQLQEYEREVVQPRHEDNQKALRKLEKIIYMGLGGLAALITVLHLVYGK